MAVPKLMIPIGIDGADALKMLKNLEAEGEKAGDAVESGAKRGKKGVENMTGAMIASTVAMQSIAVGKQMLDALADATVKASERMKQLAEDFIALRDRARELAGIMNKPGTSEFTLEQLRFAAKTGMTGEQAVDFRAAFESESAQYKGRFKEGEFDKFEQEVAKYGNQMRLPPEVMGRLAGTVVRTGAKKDQTSEEAMKELGGAFRTMQAGGGKNELLAAQLARVSGMVGPENAYQNIGEAATAVRMNAETDLGEAYTMMREMRQGVVELATKPKMAGEANELDISAQTTNMEAIKKLSAAQDKSGIPMDVFLAKIFPQQRIATAFRDNIRAYRGGIMKKGMDDVASVLAGETEASSAAYLANPEEAGALQKAQAEGKLEEAERAQERVRISTLLQRAHTQLAAGEEAPQAGIASSIIDAPWNPIGIAARTIRALKGQGYKDIFAQAEMGRAVQLGVQEAQEAGVTPEQIGRVPGTGVLTGAASKEVVHFLSRLVQLTEEANKHRKEAAQKPQPQPAIIPKMGNPQTRD